ncbi:hypothetical protein Tco_0680469 [Tanacetum coccineum]|uniref:Uncharacterized protein n=1 Tax=Tanacetum coccineum TaxID=301880 RepID=A0ABQ4XM20_9ASTR
MNANMKNVIMDQCALHNPSSLLRVSLNRDLSHLSRRLHTTSIDIFTQSVLILNSWKSCQGDSSKLNLPDHRIHIKIEMEMPHSNRVGFITTCSCSNYKVSTISLRFKNQREVKIKDKDFRKLDIQSSLSYQRSQGGKRSDQHGGNNAEASGSASRQAQQTEPAVGQDGSGGSGVGVVIGMYVAIGKGGAGVASQGSMRGYTQLDVETMFARLVPI